ncbi:MAG: hypothetical protein M3Q34_04325 [bacterium]|nr:hypothetical protein [bacterium]
MNTQNNNVLIGIVMLVVGFGLGYLVTSGQRNSVSREQTMTTDSINEQSGPITSGENPQPGSIHDMPVEPAAAVARKDLALKLGVAEKSIVIMMVFDMTWNDGCLGLGGPAESCLQALVPGFKVEMLAQGKTYIYRTDKTGGVIRAEIK